MSKLHVIGVGGTGHKVLSAVIHLAACGAFKGNLGKHKIDGIRLLTIDADDSNGNLTQTKTVLSAYRDYYTALSGADSLGLVDIEAASGDVSKLNIALFMQDKKSIDAAFNIPQYAGSPCDAFIKFLYTNDEINAEFDQGFYGHTSIGTLIVKDILSSNEVWQSELLKINADDFVIVIGSIFGGTGASAIPVLLDELAAKKKETAFKLAAVLLNPYFQTAGKIEEEGILKPDSRNFNIKAKAGLYYYYRQEQYKKTDALYVIGEPEANYSVEAASRGAANQRNKASAVELFAATSLIDFIRESKEREDGGIITAQRAAGGGNYLYTWLMLQNSLPNLPENIQNAIKTAIFYNKVLYHELANGTAAGVWQKLYDSELDKKKDDNQNLIYENIHEYLNLLVRWFYDIHKRNKLEINQNTGALMWDVDPRVKIFNAQYEKVFNDKSVSDALIENFEDIVYRDTNIKKSDALYSALCGKPPAAGIGKGFAALFATLYSFMSEQNKSFLGFGKKPPEPENFDMVPYLAKENNATFTRPNEPDKLWSKSQPTLLANIADGLPSSVGESFTKNDLSIPSPWSIFIMNELTLTEPKFAAINKAAFREWCGIIALLVLRKLNRYENQGLKLEALDVSGGDGEFLRVINDTLTPGSFIFDNPNWIKCHRLHLDGVTIAFLANNTLICPAYSIDGVTMDKLHGIAPSIAGETREFLSPDNYFKDQSQTLNRDAKYALELFLTELNTIITAQAAKNKGRIIKSLQDLTAKYLKELGSTTPNSNLAISPEKKKAVTSVAALFENLICSPSVTNIELPFIMEGAKTRSALIGTNICGISSASAEAANLLVTENMLFNQMSVAEDEYNKIPKEKISVIRDGIELVLNNRLLLDSMVMIKKDGAQVFYSMPNSSSLAEYEIIWPLHDALLDLYTPDALNRMVSLSADMEKVTVTLKIKLGERLGVHTVTKEYRIKSLSDMTEDEKYQNGICKIMEKNRIPFYSIWPYAEIKDATGNSSWQRYNCFCVEPVGSNVLAMETYFARQGDNLSDKRKLSSVSTGTDAISYKRFKTLPCAFKVKEQTGGTPVPYGVVFLKESEKIDAGAVSWNVGIDFGTTSTTAYYNTNTDSGLKFARLLREYGWTAGSKEPEYYEIEKDYLITLCDNGDGADQSRSYHRKHFIDQFCFGQNGYATIYEIMDTTHNDSSPTLFDSGRIFWHNFENFGLMNADTSGRWRDRLRANIKWEGDKTNAGKYLNQLLTQIIFQAAAKQVRKTNFFFSYPTAFGLNAKTAFTNTLSSLIEGMSKTTGMELFFDKEDSLLTESSAAAYYFINKKNLDRLFLCVDIGGGSTDVSIWTKAGNKFQTSIHFASRDMFVEPLKKLLDKKDVMNAVRTNNPSDKIYSMLDYGGKDAQIDGDKIKFLIESVLFEYKDDFVQRLNGLAGDNETAYRHFNYCVLMSYSGLMYYLANIIAKLLKEKAIESAPEIVLGLSGKGSKLRDWISAYRSKIYTETQNLITEKSGGIKIRIKEEFDEKNAKTETAKGMICNLDGSGKQKKTYAESDPVIYTGAEIDVSGTVHSNDEFIAMSKYREPEKLKIDIKKDLAALDEFIAFFNKISASSGDVLPINADWYAEYKETLWSNIISKFENTLEEKRFEPPFMVMLKTFLKVYSEEFLWKNVK